MKQRKRMGQPTARIVPLGMTRVTQRPTASAAPDETARALFADNTITRLMERLDGSGPSEGAPVQGRALPTGTSTFQPKVLRTRAQRA